MDELISPYFRFHRELRSRISPTHPQQHHVVELGVLAGNHGVRNVRPDKATVNLVSMPTVAAVDIQGTAGRLEEAREVDVAQSHHGVVGDARREITRTSCVLRSRRKKHHPREPKSQKALAPPWTETGADPRIRPGRFFELVTRAEPPSNPAPRGFHPRTQPLGQRERKADSSRENLFFIGDLGRRRHCGIEAVSGDRQLGPKPAGDTAPSRDCIEKREASRDVLRRGGVSRNVIAPGLETLRSKKPPGQNKKQRCPRGRTHDSSFPFSFSTPDVFAADSSFCSSGSSSRSDSPSGGSGFFASST